MNIRKISILGVTGFGLVCGLAACSGDSGVEPGGSDTGLEGQLSSGAFVPGSDGVFGSSSSIDGVPYSQALQSSSSKKDDGSHEGPLPGEDPGMVPVDTPLTYVGNFPVIFSEVSPENANFKDNDGNDPGWVELYNTSDAPVSLKGVALSNDAKFPRRWVFGNATIPAKSYMIVFLSGKNYADYVAPSDSVNMIGTDCSSEASAGGFGAFPGMGDWGGGMGDFGGGNWGGAGAGTGAGAATGSTDNRRDEGGPGR